MALPRRLSSLVHLRSRECAADLGVQTEKSSLFKQIGIALQADRTEKFDKMLGDYLTENFKYTMQDRIEVVTGCTQVARQIFKGNATGVRTVIHSYARRLNARAHTLSSVLSPGRSGPLV